MLRKFDVDVYSESLASTEDDPSIAFYPGPADVAERYLWKKESEAHLRQRQSLRVRSDEERHFGRIDLTAQQVLIQLSSLGTSSVTLAPLT